MNIDYSQFEYDGYGTWFGKTKITIDGVSSEILIRIDEEEDKFIPEESKLILEWYLDNCQSIHYEMLGKVLEYYCNERDELGYGEGGEENDEFPLVSDINTISSMIKLRTIVLPNISKFKKEVNLIFDASWDQEEGLGVLTEDGHVTEIGFQGIAI